jgi:hypothetical protein
MTRVPVRRIVTGVDGLRSGTGEHGCRRLAVAVGTEPRATS